MYQTLQQNTPKNANINLYNKKIARERQKPFKNCEEPPQIILEVRQNEGDQPWRSVGMNQTVRMKKNLGGTLE